MYSNIRLFRKRFIPDEFLELGSDKILYMDDSVLITSWSTIKPRKDFASGFSVYYRKEGFKISRHQNANGEFTRWYCDIMTESADGNNLTYSDLLIDVIVLPDGTVQVVDMDEAADALEQNLITADQLKQALRSADTLLRYIYCNRFNELTDCLIPYINN